MEHYNENDSFFQKVYCNFISMLYNYSLGGENVAALFILGSYLYGSIPFALVIGKLFYKTDIRHYGSGNLGGSNAGRVLGRGAGFICIILDTSKAVLVVLITEQLCIQTGLPIDISYICAIACVIGHCYPIFAHFKGGKAVSTAIGYWYAINPIGGILATILFMTVLKVSKYVSLASIIGTITILICTPFLAMSLVGKITNACIGLLLLYRHKDNMKRIKNHTERKVTWL